MYIRRVETQKRGVSKPSILKRIDQSLHCDGSELELKLFLSWVWFALGTGTNKSGLASHNLFLPYLEIDQIISICFFSGPEFCLKIHWPPAIFWHFPEFQQNSVKISAKNSRFQQKFNRNLPKSGNFTELLQNTIDSNLIPFESAKFWKCWAQSGAELRKS